MHMRKYWSLAALILAMPVASHAEPKLTLYGVLDVGVAWQNRTTTSGGTTDSGSMTGIVAGTVLPVILGVSGSHDLGNGNQVVFQLEGGTNFENGSPGFGMNPVWGRNANFGVAGKWGSLKGGFELTPFLLDIAAVDPQGLSQAGSALNFYLATLGITGLFDNRMIQYRSPDLKGFKFTAGLGTGNVPGSTSKGREMQATASFAAAGFNAGAGYLLVNDSATTGKAAESFWAGAGYAFAPVTFKAMIHDIKTGDGANHTQYFAGGVAWAITSAITAKYGYYDFRDKDVSASKTAGHTVAGNYALDKSTTVYAGYTLLDNSGGMQVVPLSGSSWGSSGAPVDLATSAFYAGMYYAF